MFWLRALILFLIYPYLKRKYGIKVAKTQFEKEQVFKFRYQIYSGELGWTFFEKISKNKILYDEYDFSDHSIILYSGDIHHITGTIRITLWDSKHLPQKFIEKYRIHPSVLTKIKKIAQIRYFQICKAYRRSLLGIIFMSALYEFTAKSETAPLCDIMFSDCQPGLYWKYEKVGGFFYTNKMLFEEYGFLEIPFALIPTDFKYMKKVGAATYFLSKYFFYIYRKKASEEDIKIKMQDFSSLLPHLTFQFNPKDAIRFEKNISDKKTREQFKAIISLIKETIVLDLEPGTTIIRKNFVDFDLFIVLAGKIGIFLNERLITKLKPGSLLGEMALIDSSHKRFTDVRSMTPCKLLLIPRGFLAHLEKKNPQAAYQFLQILCNSLLDKLNMSNLAFMNVKHKNNNLVKISEKNIRKNERKQTNTPIR